MSIRPIKASPQHDAAVGRYLARRIKTMGAVWLVVTRAHHHVPDNKMREAMWRSRYSLLPIEATLP